MYIEFLLLISLTIRGIKSKKDLFFSWIFSTLYSSILASKDAFLTASSKDPISSIKLSLIASLETQTWPFAILFTFWVDKFLPFETTSMNFS